jgi:coronin-1B/1C/6
MFLGNRRQERCVFVSLPVTDHSQYRQEQCYDNLRVSKNAWDTNLLKVTALPFRSSPTKLIRTQVNPQYLSVNWEAGGGGAFAIIPLEERGKFPERIPLFRGHTAAVLDTDW